MTDGVVMRSPALNAGAKDIAHARKEQSAGSAAFNETLKRTHVPAENATGQVRQQDANREWRLADLLSRIAIPRPEGEEAQKGEASLPVADATQGSEAPAELPSPPLTEERGTRKEVKGDLPLRDLAPRPSDDGEPHSAIRAHAPEQSAENSRKGVAQDLVSRQSAGTSGAERMDPPPQRNARAAAATNELAQSPRNATAPTLLEPMGSAREVAPARTPEPGFPKQQPFQITSIQSAPSPIAAPHLLASSTSAMIVEALSSDNTFSNAAAEAARIEVAAQAQRAASVLHSMKIQLHPAELGTITAQLSISEQQLMVEISTETNEARQRLQADGDAMLRALRGLGYEVDRITILHGINSANAGQDTLAAGRDGTGPSMDARDGHQAGRDARGRGRHESEGSSERRSEEERDATRGGSLYI